MTKPPYTCIRCGYTCNQKNDMRKHFYQKKSACQATSQNITLTEEIKEYILTNRVCRPEVSSVATLNTIKKLQVQVELLKNKKSESIYQTILESHLGGTHKTLKNGITDITTETFHAEIKEWKCWKEAVGQLMVYNVDEPRPQLRVYLFGTCPCKSKKQSVITTLKTLNILPFEITATSDNFTIIDYTEPQPMTTTNPLSP